MLREPDQVWDVLRSQSKVRSVQLYPTNNILHNLQTVTVTMMTIVMVKKFVSTVNASGQVRGLMKSYAAQMIELIINFCFVSQDVTAKLILIVVIQILMMLLHSLQIMRNARHADVSQWVLDFVY